MGRMHLDHQAQMKPNKRMQSDLTKRYALASAADARRYAFKSIFQNMAVSRIFNCVLTENGGFP